MYHRDLEHRLNLRLNDDQFNFITKQAELFGQSPSAFMRTLITSCMIAEKRLEQEADKLLERGVSVNENIKADKHDII